jgi:hypothetical protein
LFEEIDIVGAGVVVLVEDVVADLLDVGEEVLDPV